MGRRILWSVAALVFAAAAYSVVNLPQLYARVKLDRSYPALSRYEFERTPGIVLVGSSMTVRLYERYFASPVRNLAISGGSPLTGLAIIASYKSLPKLILVETNMMSWPMDEEIIKAFGANETEPYKWFRPARALISAIYRWLKYKTEDNNIQTVLAEEPTDRDISASVDEAKNEYATSNQDAAMEANTKTLLRLIAELKGRGCKFIFYELPYPDRIGETHFAVRARGLTMAAFVAEQWLRFNNLQQLRWTDAHHLDGRSAIIIANQIDQMIPTKFLQGIANRRE